MLVICLALVVGVIALSSSLLLRPVRERLLPVGLDRLAAALPGRLQVERARWPRLGHLVLEGVRWSESAATPDAAVGTADAIELAIALRPLWDRDLVVQHLSARRLQLDVPAVQRLLATRRAGADTPRRERSFPRPGALVGIPSIAIDTLQVDAPVVQLPGPTRVDSLRLEACLDARHGRVPRLQVRRAEADGPPDGWKVDSVAIDVDLEHGTATGSGSGRVTSRWPVSLVLRTDAPDHLRLQLSEPGTATPPAAMGILAQASIARRGLAVDSLLFTARVRTPGTSELARVPALATWLQSRPAAAGVQLAATGTLAMAPRPGLRLRVDFLPGDLVRAGTLALRHDNQSWSLHCDSLAVADLRLRGSIASSPDSLALSLWVDVDGERWREWVGHRLGPPWTLQAHADLRRRRDRATAAIALQGSATLAGHDIDRFGVDGMLGIGPAAASTLRLRIASHGVHAQVRGEIRRGDTLQVRLSPLWLRTTALVDSSDPGAFVATLRRFPAGGRIRCDALRIRGDAGQAELDADVEPESGGNLSARLAWPELPELLARRLGPATAESLRAHWHPDAPYTLEIAAAAGPHFQNIAGSGQFSLPGPRAFTGLAAALRVDDLGALAGSLHFEAATADPQIDLHMDAARTTWVDTLRLHVTASRNGIVVHAARLGVDSLQIDVAGTLGTRDVDLRARYEVRGATLLRRAVPAAEVVPRIPELELRGDARLLGRRAHPGFSGNVAGRFTGFGLRLPELVVAAARDSSGARVEMTLPRGITSPWIRLDRGRALWTSGSAATWLPGHLTLEADGNGLALRQSVHVRDRAPLRLTVEALRLALGDGDLEAAQPFHVLVDAEHLQVDGLALAGSLGRIAADGVASRDSTHLTAHVELDLPEPPACLVVRRDLWPRRVRADLAAPRADSVQVAATLQGFRLAGGTQPELALDLQALPHLLRAWASLADTAIIVRGDAALPLRLQLWPPGACLDDGPVAADVRFARLPFGIHTTHTPAAADLGRLQGRVVLGGTTAALAGCTDLQVRFPDTPNLAPFSLALGARVGRDARVDSLWQSAAAASPAPPASRSDLAIAFTLASESTPLVRGEAEVPLGFALVRPFVRADSTRALALRLRAEDVPLAACNPLLPRGAALHGTTTIALDAQGALQNPRFDGRLSTSTVELVLGDGSRAEFTAQATLGGERLQPRLRGDIEVKTALIKVPETQKNLHPTSGAALLRPADNDAAAGRDSVVAPPQVAIDAAGPATLAHADIDIGIHVPRAFWVRGRGLDIEGKGDLRVAQQGGRPTVAGALQGIRGSFAIAGRTLVLDRATVAFPGGTDLDPKLDVQLSTAISGTKIRVLVSGTAAAPELTLSSDPEMEQSDIIALLALGKTYDQLSDEESGIMRERATAILVSMGAAALQENVTQDLGIDVVQYRSNSGAPGAKSADEANTGSLAFGKYLSPKVLLSYSYSLDRAVEDIVSLEYFLKGQLTIETLYSVKGQSGLGFGWTKEY